MLPPFVFYNGAYMPLMYAPLGAWIKYTKGPNVIQVLAQKTNEWVHIGTPDRQLLLVRNAQVFGAARPMDMDWDEFVPFSFVNSTAREGISLDRYMVNYFQHLYPLKRQPITPENPQGFASPKTRRSANIRMPGSVVDDGKTILSDGGGFQLLTGKAEWIDPVHLAGWYSDNCDEGITLDVPVFDFFEQDYLLRSAHVQAANTKMLMDRLPERFNLFNVVHGSTYDGSRRFREIVERDGPDYAMCVAGVYHGNILQSLSRLFGHIMDTNFKPYQQYHILGVYNPAVLIPIMRFAALMRKEGHTFTISSDAGSAIVCAGNRTMIHQRAHWRSAERLFLGRNVPVGKEMNPHRILPCSCILCSTFKYVDVYTHIPDSIVPQSFIMHNMLEIDRWSKMMMLYAETLDDKDFKELVNSQLGLNSGRDSTSMALRFVDSVMASGIKAATREFQPYIKSMFSSIDDVGRFNGDPMFNLENVESNDRSEYTGKPLSWYRQRLDKILVAYEGYHSRGQADLGEKSKLKNYRSIKRIMMNTTVKHAGARPAYQQKRKALIQQEGVTTLWKGKRPNPAPESPQPSRVPPRPQPIASQPRVPQRPPSQLIDDDPPWN